MFFFFNDTATTEIYTLSLHDALPISLGGRLELAQQAPDPLARGRALARVEVGEESTEPVAADRKSTRLNSSHANISYAVFCLKKKKNTTHLTSTSIKTSKSTRRISRK